MKNWIWLAYIFMWLVVGITVCLAIYYTKNPKCLIALIVPAFVNMKSSSNKSDKDEENMEDTKS